MTERFDDWSTTASSNNSVGSAPGVNIAEAMAPGGVNNALREIMAAAALSFGGVPQGTSRPAGLATNTMWLDTTDSNIPILKWYDGTDDIVLFTINTTTNVLTGGMTDLVNDLTPQLGGNLDVNGKTITSASDGDVTIDPDGTGSVDLKAGSSSRLDITSSGVRLGAANARVTTTLDEDTFASDSNTSLATQQSIKAYVDGFIDPFAGNLLHVQDKKSSGTDGGGFTSGVWQKRDLNTQLTNEISGASLSGSVIELPAGTYWIEASAPAFRLGKHKVRWRNTTDGADVIIGLNAEAEHQDDVTTHSLVSGRFTIAATKSFELQHRAENSQASNGFGRATSFGVSEIYATVKIWKMDPNGVGFGHGSGGESAIHGARVWASTTTNIKSTNTLISFDRETFDSHSLHDNSTNNSRLTADVDGYWSATASVGFDVDQQYTALGCLIKRDGTTDVSQNEIRFSTPGNATPDKQVSTGVFFLSAGQYLEVFSSVIPDTNHNVTEHGTWFSMYRVGS